MPKLLTIDRKLRTLSRRIVTDAGGAPCCCSPSDTCPCDPALRLATFRADTCNADGRYNPATFALSAPARIAIVRLTWALAWETLDRTALAAIAERGSSTGTAQWCVLHSTTGSNQLAWVLSGATSGFEYQRAGTTGETVTEMLSYAGPDALLVPTPEGARGHSALGWSVASKNSLTWRGIPTPVAPLLNDYTGSCDQDTTQASSNGRTSERLTYQFIGDAAGGAASFSVNYRSAAADGVGLVTRTGTTEAEWSIRYLTCESGGPDQLTRPEGGCSNCGDRATLEPWA